MTALLGLDHRLRLAKLGWELDAAAPDLVGLAADGFAAGVDLLVVAQGARGDAEVLPQLEQIRAEAPRRALVGLRGSAALGSQFAADLRLLGPDDGPVRQARRGLHKWALVGLATGRRAALTQLDADFLWLEPLDRALLAAAVQAAPATAERSRPWFAVGSGAGAAELLDRGACRIGVSTPVGAVTPGAGGTAERDAAVAELATVAERLRSVWAADPALRRVAFSGGTGRR